MALAAANAYTLWAPEYDSTPNPLLALEERTLAQSVKELARGRVVEVGCGTGRWGRLLEGVASGYTGVDCSIEMLRRAGKGCFAAADATALPLRGAVADLTLCSFAAGYFARLGEAFREMARVTRLGGAVIVSDMHPESGWARTFRHAGLVHEIEHRRHSVAEMLRAAREAGLLPAAQHTGRFGEPERPLFRAAGREDLFEKAAGVPAVWAGIWTLP